MFKKISIIITFLLFASIAFSQQPFSWFAEPFTVGFNYTDDQSMEQQSSSWQPGLFQFFVDDNYNSGSFLTPTTFNIDNWVDEGGTDILKNRMLISYDKINLSDENGIRTFIDKNGYSLFNGASFQTIKAYNNSNNGQIDLYTGHNNHWIARIGATNPGSDRGSMTLYGTNGFEQVDISVDENNKGKVEASYAELEKITVESDGTDFSGIFEGGKGVRIQSINDNTADLTLQANSDENPLGVIQSDPNYSNSSLVLKSYGSVLVDLDANDGSSGLFPFVISNNGELLFYLNKENGAVLQRFTGSNPVGEPHLTIRDLSSDGYGRINIGNVSAKQWQIAGKPTGTTKWLLFHLTDDLWNQGLDKMQLSGNGNLFIEGVYGQISDINLKTNITPVRGALDRVAKVGGYHYNWIDKEKSPSMQTGVIAQEIQAEFPELVQANSNGNLSVNYDGLIPYLIESIKELKAEIDTLKTTK